MTKDQKILTLLSDARETLMAQFDSADSMAIIRRIDAVLQSPAEECEGCTMLREAFHDATRLRGEIQKARIKAEDERDEARAAVADAYQRGAESMREQVASLFDGGQNVPGLMKSPEFRDFIRNLPIPEDK